MLDYNYRADVQTRFCKNRFKNFLKIIMKPAVAESLSLQLHGIKEGLHNGSFLVNFTNFFRIAFQQNSSGRLLLKVCEIREHCWCSHFCPLRKHYTENYLIIFERVDKLSRKNIYIWRKHWIWATNLDYYATFYWIWTRNFGNLDWKFTEKFGQRFIIILIRYFTGAGLWDTWTTNLDSNYHIFTGLGL